MTKLLIWLIRRLREWLQDVSHKHPGDWWSFMRWRVAYELGRGGLAESLAVNFYLDDWENRIGVEMWASIIPRRGDLVTLEWPERGQVFGEVQSVHFTFCQKLDDVEISILVATIQPDN